MNKRFYLDTSIWLDLIEERNESNLPKSKLAKEFLNKIISKNYWIIYSEIISDELKSLGYTDYDIENLIARPFKDIIIVAYFIQEFFGKAKDLSNKREIPVLDALHALIARDQKAILITRDKHFKRLIDIVKSKKPEEILI